MTSAAVPWFRASAAGAVAALCAALVVAAHPSSAGAAPTGGYDRAVFAKSTSSITVYGRGNGHGHGLSQYGAQGAAIAGLSSQEIVRFYYPGTTLKTLSASTVRVSVSGAGSETAVAAESGLTVVGGAALPSGYTRFRLVPDGSGLALGGMRASGAWVRIRSGLPTRADFSTSSGSVRLYLSNGTSTRYRGTVGAVRNGSGILTINRVSLDGYTMGVVPREMPASWRAAALGAQAIAARSYGRNAVESHGGSLYDICDTTWCQVYGGMTHYSSGGSVLWQDAPSVVQGNQNTVLQYGGRTIFAQFSASNGGAMLDGGTPYLVDKADPYDASASGDPYLNWTDSVSASSLASYYGLKSVSTVDVNERNGVGPWGGWVLSATVTGTSWSGETKHVSTTGNSLASALGARTAYFRFEGAPSVPGAPMNVRAVPGDSGSAVYWDAPSGTVSSYHLVWGHHSYTLPGTARSMFVSPIWQSAPENVWIAAINSVGTGPAAKVSVQANPHPQKVVAISPVRIIDTRDGAPLDATHPYEVDVAGLGTLPQSGATSVQLALTITHPSESGTLDIYVHGSPGAPAVSVPYWANRVATTTVSVPLRPSSSLIFKPRKGSLDVLGVQESYTASWGKYLRPVAPTWTRTFDPVSTDGSTRLTFAGAPVVNGDTQSVLLSVHADAGADTTWLRLWPDDRSEPEAVHVTATPYGPSANTVLVRLPSSGVIHVAAGKPGVRVTITLVGTTGNGGGRFEALPSTVIADNSVPSRPSLAVGTHPISQQLRGIADTPTSARAVLVQFRVTATAAGTLYAGPDGVMVPVVTVPAGHAQVATALMMLGADGTISLASTTPGMTVSLRSMGYLTSS